MDKVKKLEIIKEALEGSISLLRKSENLQFDSFKDLLKDSEEVLEEVNFELDKEKSKRKFILNSN